MNILILKISAIGDVIHTIPAVMMLRFSFPHNKIFWVVQKKAASVIQGQDFLDGVFVLPDKAFSFGNFSKTITIIGKLRKISWDIIIDFQGIFKTSIILFFLKGKKFGFSKDYLRSPFTRFFTDLHDNPQFINIVQKNLSLVSFVVKKILNNSQGINLHLKFLHKNYIFCNEEKKTVLQWLDNQKKGKKIICCPNTTWQTKLWPLDHWQVFFDLIEKTQNYLALIVGSYFGSQAEELVRQNKGRQNIIIVPQWSFSQIGFLISKSDLLIAPDTGFLHYADFLNIKSIGLWGPTNVSKHGPFWLTQNKFFSFQASCIAPYKRKFSKIKKCFCMNQIKPIDVYNLVKNII